ncbi:hypothetical protein SIO70_07970 [Chitinophaga sancti]|uniref:hypothetical protein n=1 Tax=Chitinophaga sancti TaxID=1004 RepID=UPI002A764C06|nr:hypothetical protein [Chitinophaga sancti]WPQ64803.1 hypothetical protein SIO70_07970 [Chitinophaga sancti]
MTLILYIYPKLLCNEFPLCITGHGGEHRTHVTLWCMFQSPFMMRGNMPENIDIINKLLINKKVLDIQL